MGYAASAGAAGAAAAAAIANAIKASGAIVQVGPRDFEAILSRTKEPLVVCSESGVFSTKYHYLAPYRGLFFYTRTPQALHLPAEAEVVRAKKIWVPG